MCKLQTTSDDTKSYKPKYELQDIFRLYGDDYIARHKLKNRGRVITITYKRSVGNTHYSPRGFTCNGLFGFFFLLD